MHKDGLIYRSNRLVNWCTKLRTALSNLEVNYFFRIVKNYQINVKYILKLLFIIYYLKLKK